MNNVAAGSAMRARIVTGFEDSALQPARWDSLVASSTDVVFLTFSWQREWWRAFGGPAERLLIVLGERDGELCAVAPLFAAKEMLFLVGSDGSDYLDFIGNLDEPALASLLHAASRELPDFTGIGLYHVPRTSPTTALLPGVAERLGLELSSGEGMRAPYADLGDPERVSHLLERRGLRKAEARMRRDGPLRARAAGEGELEDWLDLFFAQHATLWPPGEGWQRDEARAFCRAIVHTGQREGWLRFSMLEWQERAVAFEITLIRGGGYLSYLGSRDTSLDRYSPGAVLQAHTVRAAIEDGARRWDFGLGEEAYKMRDASGTVEVANWFMYPP
jgi:CelD/BcsL family acetyltransferase involved in cellulose biosynthesis